MKNQLFTIALVFLAMASFGQKYGATPEDSLTCLENSSLYKEFYKQKNYIDARGPWMKAVMVCPKSSKNLYIKGASMYKKFIVIEKDAGKKLLLVDTLMWIYDQRIINYGQKGNVLGRKGVDLARYDKSKTKEAYDLLAESFTLEGNKSQKAAITTYYQLAEKLVKSEEIEKTVLFDLFPKLQAVVVYNLGKAKSDSDKSKWFQVAAILEQIFSKYAGCAELVEIYTPKYDANPKDTSVLIQIIAFFEKSDCTSDPLFLKASMSLDAVKPSSISKFGIGRSLLKKERFSEAIGYFKESAELAGTKEGKINSYKYIALTQLSLKQYASVKSYALKMITLNPNSADAYMILGDAYLYGSRTVGENPCEQAGGYWAAPSKYAKAKSLDASLVDKINKKIAS
ncbi:MAG: tetratricopeptide (TPR) repeat protein, partial [Salibacteraceae bacterium]